MRRSSALALALTALPSALGAGCGGLAAGFEDDPARLQVDSLLSGYLSPDALPPVPEKFLTADFLGSKSRPSEVLGFELWPLVGAGAGTDGIRARILSLEAAIGGSPRKKDAKRAAPSAAVAKLLGELR